jgi:Zn-dependent protease
MLLWRKVPMIKPEVLSRDSQVTKLATVFKAPLVVVPDISVLPLIELITSAGLSRWAKTRHPEWSLSKQVAAGVVTMLVALGSEWAHNLAHSLAARLVGKPVDAIRVVFGMPLLVYHDLHDPDVTPKQHILRGLGGPLFNLLMIPLARWWQQCSPEDSLGREAADAALATNIFLVVAGLQPIPGLDGGVILKWALVDRGQSIPQADDNVRKANWLSGAVMAAGSRLAFRKRKRIIGGVLGMLAGVSFLVAKGWLKEA